MGPRPLHSWGFTITFRHTAAGRSPLDEWSARRRASLPHNNHKRETTATPGGIRTLNPNKRAATDPRLTKRSHWDRLTCNWKVVIQGTCVYSAQACSTAKINQIQLPALAGCRNLVVEVATDRFADSQPINELFWHWANRTVWNFRTVSLRVVIFIVVAVGCRQGFPQFESNPSTLMNTH